MTSGNQGTIIFKNPLSEDSYKQRKDFQEDDVCGAYFKDQTAIIHSLPFRRLKHKTQVFFSPTNDHVCTRIEHSLHVANIAENIARNLNLNGELAYAIGLAHDLGHAPFGHAGETSLAAKCTDIGGFQHQVHGLRIVDVIGDNCSMNLTYGVRDGIISHAGDKFDPIISPRTNNFDLHDFPTNSSNPASYEGCIVRMADRIAYLGRDLADSIYGGFVSLADVPKEIKKGLGTTNQEIINTLVVDAIKNSKLTGTISYSDDIFEVLTKLYKFSHERIYSHPDISFYKLYCRNIIDNLFDHLIDLMIRNGWEFKRYQVSRLSLDRLFGNYLAKFQKLYLAEKASYLHIARDYIAGMTDGFAINCMQEIAIPHPLIFSR